MEAVVPYEYKMVAGFRKNSKLLLLTTQQQLFKIKSSSASGSRYICYTKDCKVSVALSNSGVCTQMSVEHNHDHPAPIALIKEMELINNVKDKCEKSDLKRKGVREIFLEECQDSGQAAPSVAYPKIRRQLFRIRSEITLKNPQSPNETKMLFEDKDFMQKYGTSKQSQEPFYKATILGENFAYCIFLSPSIVKLIEKLPDERYFFLDGTFDTVPSCGFKQLLIVHYQFRNHIFPFIYILLTNKSQEAYEHLFAFLDANFFKFQPKSFTSDYEMALRNALKNIFPTATLNGCWFHYCQALRRNSLKIPNFGATLKNDVNCYKWYRTFFSLPLVQPRQTEEMFTNLKDQLMELPQKNQNDLKMFLEYFKEHWMVKTTPAVFSVHSQIMRTTSSLKSFHAELARKLPKHGRFHKFLEVIRDEDYNSSIELASALDGDLCKKQKFKEQRIDELLQDLNASNISLSEFFRCLIDQKNDFLKWDINFEESYSDVETYHVSRDCPTVKYPGGVKCAARNN